MIMLRKKMRKVILDIEIKIFKIAIIEIKREKIGGVYTKGFISNTKGKAPK